MKKVIIIGAGVSGLAAAAILAKNGFEVELLEKNKTMGGRAMQFSARGFTFDMGPSWYLMPDVFEKYFNIFGKNASDFYKLKRLDPSYRVFFADTNPIDIPSQAKDTAKLFDQFENEGGKKFLKYLSESKYLYDISIQKYLYRSYSQITDFLDPKLITRVWKLRLLENMKTHVNRSFTSDKAQKLLMYNLVFLGGDPLRTPALYSLMAHVDFELGAWYPKGGIYSVMEAFHKIGKKMGVKYRFSTEAKQIVIRNNFIKGVKTNKGFIHADIVLSTGDYWHTQTKLLSKKYQSYPKKYWDKKTVAPSAYVLYLGLDRKINNLKHHNIYFASDWEKHFSDIFDHPNWPDDPSFYICVPSKSDKSVAPQDSENIFVLVPIAAGITDLSKFRAKIKEHIIEKMSQLAGIDIKKHIVFSRDLSIKDYKDLYFSYKGSAFGLSHTLSQTAFFRPSHQSKVRNLYFAGHYTHPGIGLPTSVISAQVVADLISKHHG